MEFISANEFLKQDEKVQKVFLDWWKPSIGDLYKWISNSTFEDVQVLNKSEIDTFKYYEINFKKDCIPLLAEGQLRKFIEDNTYCKLNIGTIGNIIKIYEKELDIPFQTDLLQAYWKVAIQIAEQEGKKND